MSQFHVKGRDEMVTCPFNPSHRISNGRMPNHLVKCKRNHDMTQFTTCPFNASHIIRFTDRSHHISICPDKAVVERQMLSTGKINANKLDQHLIADVEVPQASENWDAEVGPFAAPGYDPSKHMNEQTFRNANSLSAMTRSQKKQFRQSWNQSSSSERQENSNDDDDLIDTLITAPLKQLRLPREDGPAALSMHALGLGHSTPATSISRQSSNIPTDNESIGVKTMLAISKGRGIRRSSDASGPGKSAPGLGAVNEAVRAQSRSTFESEDCSRKVGVSQAHTLTSDNSSSASEEYDANQSSKLKNRLQKKLNQINVLIEMQANGQNLNREELQKIAKRDELLRVLELLSKK